MVFYFFPEPNISFLRNWVNGTCQDSTFDEYLTLYNHTVRAIKSVNSKIKVGGPATAGLGWIDQFLDGTKTHNIPIDFVSSHSYPPRGSNKTINTDLYYNSLNTVNKDLDEYNDTYPNMPFYLSEFNSGLFWLAQDENVKYYDNQDTIYASSFMLFQMNKLQKLFGKNNRHFKSLSYWTFSDIFEEGGFKSYPFWPNKTAGVGNDYYFGMTTIRGINKPVFNVFSLVYNYGSNVSYDTQLVNGNKDASTNTVSLFCLKNTKSSNRYGLFITNYADYPYPEYEFKNVTASIYVTQTINPGLKQPKQAMTYRIDKKNGNSYQEWLKMGKPRYPTQEQMQQLKKASELQGVSTTWNVVNSTTVEFYVNIPKYTVIFIDIMYQ